MTDTEGYSKVVDFFGFEDLDDLIRTNPGDIVHLFDGDYSNLLYEIDEWIGQPKADTVFNMDYESMKLLLEQAKNKNIDFYLSVEKRAKFILFNCNQEAIERILKEEGYTNPEVLSSLIDPHLYRHVYDCLNVNNDMSEANEKRKHALDHFINNIELWNNPYNIMQHVLFYNYTVEFDLFIREYIELPVPESIRVFALDLLSDYLFEDYYLNVWNDINQIIKYVGLTKTNLIPQERLNFYNVFAQLKDADVETIRAFFNQNKTVKIMDCFYDDIRALKDDSYQSLIDCCTEFNKESPLYNKELSNTYGCDIYYLNGEGFNAFARTNERLLKGRYKLSEDKSDIPGLTLDDVNKTGFSFTYINGNDVQTYHDPRINVTLLYKGLKKEHIGHVYKNDSESDPKYYYYSDKINELHTPDSITRESTMYPEIVVTEPGDAVPIALLCLDTITDWDIAFSKKFSIPIALANTLKYERKYDYEDIRDNNYIR